MVVRYRPYKARDGLTGFADITLDGQYFLNPIQIFGSEIRGPRPTGRSIFSIIQFRRDGQEIFEKAFQSIAGSAAFTWEAKHACPPPEEPIPKKNPDFIPSLHLSDMAKFDLNLMGDFDWLIGTDEVGTGALAGPVGAAAASYPRKIIETPPEELKGITDSKRLSEKDRERYAEVIKKYAKYEIEIKDIPKAERWTPTIKMAITESVDHLADRLNGKKRVIIDSGPSNLEFSYDFERIKGGDIFSLSIASAAILAKVERDQIMKKLSEEFPQYKWNKNKGYSSLDHTDAIRRYGKSKYHHETASKEH